MVQAPQEEVAVEYKEGVSTETVKIYEYKGKRYEVSKYDITDLETDTIRPLDFRDEVVSKGTAIEQIPIKEKKSVEPAKEEVKVLNKPNWSIWYSFVCSPRYVLFFHEVIRKWHRYYINI